MATPTPTPLPKHVAKNTILALPAGNRFRFNLQTLQVKVGAVTWKNSSNAPHTVTSGTHGWTFDKKLALHKQLSFAFKKTETFLYYCRFHKGMVGKIVVHR